VGVGAHENFDFISGVLADREITKPIHENENKYNKIQKDFANVMCFLGELGKA